MSASSWASEIRACLPDPSGVREHVAHRTQQAGRLLLLHHGGRGRCRFGTEHRSADLRSQNLEAANCETRKTSGARCLRLSLSLSEAMGHLHQHGLVQGHQTFQHHFRSRPAKIADIGLVTGWRDSELRGNGDTSTGRPRRPAADVYSLGKFCRNWLLVRADTSFGTRRSSWLWNRRRRSSCFQEIIRKA